MTRVRETGPDVEGPTSPIRRVRPSRGRTLLTLTLVVILLSGLAAAAALVVTQVLGEQVTRVPNVFGSIPAAGRPAGQPGTTFLIIGTDTRSPVPTTGTDAPTGVDPGSQRSDAIMVASLAPDGRSAALASIPRDSWVDIPGRGKDKINAAYAYGGAPLLVRTVEQLTGIRIDHFAVIDFAGFQTLVDAVGGIDVQLAKPKWNEGISFRPGSNHLDGRQTLAYVRQRHGLPNGDLDRVRREQSVMRALLDKAASSRMIKDPVGVYRLLDATTRTISVDDSLTTADLRSLGLSATGLRRSTVTFLTAPVSGTGVEGPQDVVYLDTQRDRDLWSAIRDSTADQYALAHPDVQLGVTTA